MDKKLIETIIAEMNAFYAENDRYATFSSPTIKRWSEQLTAALQSAPAREETEKGVIGKLGELKVVSSPYIPDDVVIISENAVSELKLRAIMALDKAKVEG